jgi:hypothetical protein
MIIGEGGPELHRCGLREVSLSRGLPLEELEYLGLVMLYPILEEDRTLTHLLHTLKSDEIPWKVSPFQPLCTSSEPDGTDFAAGGTRCQS